MRNAVAAVAHQRPSSTSTARLAGAQEARGAPECWAKATAADMRASGLTGWSMAKTAAAQSTAESAIGVMRASSWTMLYSAAASGVECVLLLAALTPRWMACTKYSKTAMIARPWYARDAPTRGSRPGRDAGLTDSEHDQDVESSELQRFTLLR